MFEIGQLVVCVDDEVAEERDSTGIYRREDKVLERGQVYTIRGLSEQEFRDPGSNRVYTALGMWVEEVRRVVVIGNSHSEIVWEEDAVWGAVRFRPVLKRNIEIVQELLLPTPITEKVLEDA